MGEGRAKWTERELVMERGREREGRKMERRWRERDRGEKEGEMKR